MYWIQLNELHLGVNVLRPVSRSYLEHLLTQDEAYYADESTAGAWYYKPAPVETETEDDDLGPDEDEE